MASSAASRTIRLGDTEVEYPSALVGELVDSGPLLRSGELAALRERLSTDGYVLIRGGLDREAVLRARASVIAELAKHAGVLVPEKEDEGVLYERCMAGCIPFFEGRNALTHSPEMAAVLEGEEIRRIAAALLDTDEVATMDYKWLRAAWSSFFTGAHLDRVYMSRGSQRLLTSWVPFDPEATCELGALAILEGSHRLPGFARLQTTYGELDVERDGVSGTGWFSNSPTELAAMDSAARWRVTDYRAGDVIFFTMRTVHMSTVNTTPRVRISADVRWQPAADERDERYFGDVEAKLAERTRSGAWAKDDTKPVAKTMADLRSAWGFGPAAAEAGGTTAP